MKSRIEESLFAGAYDFCAIHQIPEKNYLEFLVYLYETSKTERPYLNEAEWLSNAKKYGEKLILTFGTIKNATNYLARYAQVVKERGKKNKQPVHDALLFEIPDGNWSLKIWQKIISTAKPNGPDNEIMRLLPLAGKLEEYLNNPENREAITSTVARDIIETQFKKKYREDFKKISLIQESDWVQNELSSNYCQKLLKTLPLNQVIEQLQFAHASEENYIQYRLKSERFVKSVVKSQIANIIPFSEKIPLKYILLLLNNCLYKRAIENPDAAKLFFKYRLSEESFNRYLQLLPLDSTEFIPDIQILGKDIDDYYKSFILHKLDSSNPEAALLGKLTSCCQSLGEEGESCVEYGLTNPDSGFFALRNTATQQVIAQCWVWCDKKGNLVMDSIEININYQKKFQVMIKDFFILLANQLTTHNNVSAVFVGTGGNTPKKIPKLKAVGEIIFPLDYEGYRDSKKQLIVSHAQLPLLFLYLHENPESKIAISPIHLNEKDTLLWCDFCFSNSISPFLPEQFPLSFALKKEAMVQRLKLTEEWTQNFKNLAVNWPHYRELAEKINVSIKSEQGLSALWYHVRRANLQVVQELIQLGADVNSRFLDGTSVLACALNTNKNLNTLVPLLLSKGADPNSRDNEDTSVIHYIQDVKTLEHLFEYGIDIYLEDEIGENLLFLFSDPERPCQNWDIFKFLVEHGVPLRNGCQGQTIFQNLTPDSLRQAIDIVLTACVSDTLAENKIRDNLIYLQQLSKTLDYPLLSEYCQISLLIQTYKSSITLDFLDLQKQLLKIVTNPDLTGMQKNDEFLKVLTKIDIVKISTTPKKFFDDNSLHFKDAIQAIIIGLEENSASPNPLK